MRVEVSDQVVNFLRRQAPQPRRALRLALHALEKERGDIRALEGPLSGYHRLRVGPYRILFAYVASPGEPTCARCVFAERRDLVYTVFQHVLEKRLLSD